MFQRRKRKLMVRAPNAVTVIFEQLIQRITKQPTVFDIPTDVFYQTDERSELSLVDQPKRLVNRCGHLTNSFDMLIRRFQPFRS